MKCTGAGLQCGYDFYSAISICQNCGELGQACCTSTTLTACKNPAAVCDTYSSFNGICALCGSTGGPCCAGSVCTEANTACSSSRCAKCGSTGSQCCGGNLCTSGCCVSRFGGTSYGTPTCAAAGSACETSSYSGLTCAATGGSCQGADAGSPCGGIGQSCCSSGLYASSTSYNYCGAPGSRCTYSSANLKYTCTACGDKGQACCIDSTTSGTACKSPYKCVSTYSGTGYVYMCSDSTSTSSSIATGIH